MSNIYIRLYNNNPTSGDTDGQEVSRDGQNTNPVTAANLNATLGSISEPIKLALRCLSGFRTRGVTTISLTGSTAHQWSLAPDVGGSPGSWNNWGQSLTINDVIKDKNTIFWIRARTDQSEPPMIDRDVKIKIESIIEVDED